MNVGNLDLCLTRIYLLVFSISRETGVTWITSPNVQSSIMIHTGLSVMTPISFTMCGWSNCRIVTAEAE